MTYDIYGGLINLKDPAMGQAMATAMLTTAPVPLCATDPPPGERMAGGADSTTWAS